MLSNPGSPTPVAFGALIRRPMKHILTVLVVEAVVAVHTCGSACAVAQKVAIKSAVDIVPFSLSRAT